MVRGKGKGKKHSTASAHDDTGSGEEEKSHVRRRGRPQKALKDDIEVKEAARVQNEDFNEEMKETVPNNGDIGGNGRKRKKPSQVEEIADSIIVDNGVGTKENTNQLIRSVGFRQIGSRRKNKPTRAAEVGVECICS